MLLLYSTNCYLKFAIHRDHFGDQHYCWCSPHFNAKKLASYSPGAGTPASSDPCSIYEDLNRAMSRPDDHCEKIASQKKNLTALAIQKCTEGHISPDVQAEIVTLIDMSSNRDWRPLLYVIPYNAVQARLKPVDRKRRASAEMEYIVEDLQRSEFEIVEFPHA